ncbi:MAG: sugar diacid recognition domain-containing protein, partial [Candidatus Caldatribacteriota bacterium]|nr:sugar diacid recognition domain-containing protein [Candidatus Caldatribacteriota bacterium]
MKITHKLAQDIVDKTMKILRKNINIMDENGIIIGSGNKNRLNQFHEGAAQVIKERKKLEIYSKDINHLAGARPGINLPIEHNNKIIGVVGITGEPNEVSPYGEVIKMTVEMMLQQEFLLKELHLEQQARENFIQDLISGRIGNDTDLFLTRGQIVGYDVLIPRVALVMDIYQFEKTAKQSLQTFKGKKEGEIYLQRLKNDVLKTVQRIFIDNPQEIVSYTGGDRFVVLKIINLRDSDEILRKKLCRIGERIKNIISQKMKFKVTIGIGEYHQGIQGLNKSFKEATKALDVGTKLEGAGGIYYIDELGIGRILAEIKKDTQQEIIQEIFYSTKDLKGKKMNETLLETLKAFFDNNLSISKTAKAIYTHRNTLLYRLRRVKEITGLDPKMFDDAVQLRIA